MAASADDTALDAVVLWDSAVCPGVIPVLALARPPFAHAIPFHLGDVAGRAHVLGGSKGVQHVMLAGRGGTAQLVVTGVSVLERPYLLTDLTALQTRRTARLGALDALNALWRTRAQTSTLSRDRPLPDRMRAVLRALDACLAGLS